MKKTKKPSVAADTEVCQQCSEPVGDFVELVECPSCGVPCCTYSCIAGVGVPCFKCEELEAYRKDLITSLTKLRFELTGAGLLATSQKVDDALRMAGFEAAGRIEDYAKHEKARNTAKKRKKSK